MPLYDFRCKTCGDFEALRTIAELNVPMTCPICSEIVQRLFSPPMVNLNSGRLPSSDSGEPARVRRIKAPQPPKYQTVKGGRPWMLGHASERL
ncbi:zinc ribbon domain-containing protein [Oscillatoria sp. FACHB-1406]|uniref:FmdB family zinc ribbon protein n=1 Tax=Oscillatoria sp. FACHB-1406 TaxID=2692846 RepID=UPI0016867308|nr:zinc ribbon domain-containing protein [Oscillatoria sp. FACHB-1406]MBD2577499.1 zinc ribbon domain-containing protein [Oscillatoria sp. FACHB-1406]